MVSSSDSRQACMTKRKRVGLSGHPCLTPTEQGTATGSPPRSNVTSRSAFRRLMTWIRCGGTPNLASTMKSTSRGTESNALTRSTNSTHDSSPCSRRFFRAWRMQKLPSMQPRPPEKPFCSSMPISFNSRCRRSLITIDMILEAASSSMMPRQLLRSRRSPFFGNIFSRMRANSFRSAETLSGTGVSSPFPLTVVSSTALGAMRSESGKISRKPFVRSLCRSAGLAPSSRASACVVAVQ